MELLFQLPSETEKLLGLFDDESIYYCAPYDISEEGTYLDHSFVVVTGQRLFVTKEGMIELKFMLKDLEQIICEPHVGNGILIVKEKEGKSLCEKKAARFSMKHLIRFSYLAKGAQLFAQGNDQLVDSKENEKTCNKCGRALPGTKECPKCDGNMGMWVRFWSLCGGQKRQIAAVSILMLITSVINLSLPEVQKRFIDNHLLDKSGTLSDILLFIGVYFFLILMLICIQVCKNWLCVSLGSKVAMDIRLKLYHKIQVLSLSFIQEKKPGALMNRISQDTMVIKTFMEEAFGHMFTMLTTMLGATAFMLMMSWKLTLISIIFMPIAVFVSLLFRRRIHRRFHMQWVKQDKVSSGLQDVISGMRVVKSFGKEYEEAEKFNILNQELAKVQKKNEVFFAIFYPLLTFIMGMGLYFVTYFGGKNVLNGSLTPGELLQFISYAGILYGPLGWMTHLPRMITRMLTSLGRICDILDEQPAVVDRKSTKKMEIQGNIEFKNVGFGYKSYEPVLENIDLMVKKGEMIGLVGASGTGKSTMINLIMHLYEVDEGELLIDDVNINDWNMESYHSQIGVVLQETFLFSGTILNNLLFAKPDATYEEVIMAAKMANAHDFICKTADGYNTYVGEHGYNLSGGERQRLAIARAILNRPKILILDEATSSLDTESEYLIQKALERLTYGRTTFAIAHRLSTLKDADRLVVIDGHRIAEVGTHNELMDKKGIYYGLVTAQLEMQSEDKN